MINADHMAGWYVGRRSKVLISCGTPPPISLIWFQCSAPSNTPPTQFCFLHCLNSPWWQNKINWTTKPDIHCDWTIRPGRDLMVVNEGQGCGWVDGLHRPNRKCRWCNDLIMTELLYLTLKFVLIRTMRVWQYKWPLVHGRRCSTMHILA